MTSGGPIQLGSASLLDGCGTLQIGEGGAAGSISALVVSGLGEVIFNHNETNDIFGTLIGFTGGVRTPITVIHDGPRTTTRTNSLNGYSNGTRLNGGVLAVAENDNLGDSAGTLTFNGGTLRTTAGFTMNRATTIPRATASSAEPESPRSSAKT